MFAGHAVRGVEQEDRRQSLGAPNRLELGQGQHDQGDHRRADRIQRLLECLAVDLGRHRAFRGKRLGRQHRAQQQIEALEHALAPVVELAAAAIRGAHMLPRDARRAFGTGGERAAEIIMMLVEPFMQHRIALSGSDLHPGAAGVGDGIVDSSHIVAEVLEDGGSLRDFARDVALHELAEVRMKRDPKFFRQALEDRNVGNPRMRQRVGIRRMIADHRVHEERGVAHSPHDRAMHGGVVPLLHPERRVVRDPAVGRLQPVASGVTCGDSHRSAAIGSGRNRHDAARDRSRSASRRASGRALEIPRIASRAEQQVLGECGVAELGRVGLADHDRAGRLQARDLDRILVGHIVFERLRSIAGHQPDSVFEVFDPEWQPRQRADFFAARDLLVERARLGHCGVAAQRNECIELRVGGIYSPNRHIHQFAGLELALANHRSKFVRWFPIQFTHRRHLPCRTDALAMFTTTSPLV